ncbi:MAG TPA: DNA sulfur modification protein DndB [Symbiobacteriaceae bacterium]|jgi:DNA sulfur modification protein DndB
MSNGFSYTFPAIRGIQASREYYASMCPLRLIPRIFLFDEEELSPELRAQRVLNRARIPAISSYLLDNPTEYVLSALTASIDGDVDFVPASTEPAHYNVGWLRVPMEAKFVINDGQHRRAAIETALKEKPELGDETIAIVFFVDTGLRRSQQMFADLNRYAVRSTQSLSILYDYRDPVSQMVRDIVRRVPAFNGLTEMEKSTISNRSTKLFTLSGIYRATVELLEDSRGRLDQKALTKLAVDFWNQVAVNITEWAQVKDKLVSASELRKDYLIAHTVTLVALGRAGRTTLSEFPEEWHQLLCRLRPVNWHRQNTRQWEGRAMVGGHITNSRSSVVLLTNEIKRILGLPLSREEQAAETAFIAAQGA